MPPISSVVIDRFKRLPRRSDEVWQGGLVRARVWVEEPDGLIEQFGDEPTALWRYGRALSAFRREGDSRAARECLRAALRTNRHVPQLLTDDAARPGPEPAAYAPGSREEAVICDSDLGEAWRATPNATRWLRAHAPLHKSGKRRKR